MNSTTAAPLTRPEVTGINPARARSRVRAQLHRDSLSAADLIAPILVQPDARPAQDYANLPTAVPISRLGTYTRELRRLGVRGVKLFVYCEHKAADASDALRPNNLMINAIRAVRAATEDIVIATEVCGCAWTDHGECVILDDRGRTNLEATYELMTRMALAHARAGADVIGPAAMLDGSVNAIRTALNDAGCGDVGLTPSVIFDSSLFGPYKTMMRTDPKRGCRRGFQIDGTHQRQALTQAERWLTEGADGLLIQPAMMAVDVLTRIRQVTAVPLTAFSVSGEQAMFATVSTAVVLEYARMLKRAGADLIMTYDALRIARALAGER